MSGKTRIYELPLPTEPPEVPDGFLLTRYFLKPNLTGRGEYSLPVARLGAAADLWVEWSRKAYLLAAEFQAVWPSGTVALVTTRWDPDKRSWGDYWTDKGEKFSLDLFRQQWQDHDHSISLGEARRRQAEEPEHE